VKLPSTSPYTGVSENTHLYLNKYFLIQNFKSLNIGVQTRWTYNLWCDLCVTFKLPRSVISTDFSKAVSSVYLHMFHMYVLRVITCFRVCRFWYIYWYIVVNGKYFLPNPLLSHFVPCPRPFFFTPLLPLIPVSVSLSSDHFTFTALVSTPFCNRTLCVSCWYVLIVLETAFY
jgi:hypothetical protein